MVSGPAWRWGRGIRPPERRRTRGAGGGRTVHGRTVPAEPGKGPLFWPPSAPLAASSVRLPSQRPGPSQGPQSGRAAPSRMRGSRAWAAAERRATPAWLGGNLASPPHPPGPLRESSGNPSSSRSASGVKGTLVSLCRVPDQVEDRLSPLPFLKERIPASLRPPPGWSLQLPRTDAFRKRDFGFPLDWSRARGGGEEEPEAFGRVPRKNSKLFSDGPRRGRRVWISRTGSQCNGPPCSSVWVRNGKGNSMETEKEAHIPEACSLEAGGPWLQSPRGSARGVCSAYASWLSAGFQERGEGRSRQVNASWAGEPLDPCRPEAP